MVIYTYLTYNGNCREAMKFYQKCLGGKLYIQNLGIYPGAEKMPRQMKHCILQATLTNRNFKLTGTDLVAEGGLKKGNSISLLLNCQSETEIISCYKKLSEGGKQLHTLKMNFTGGLSGDLTDKFGNQWLLCYQKK